MLMVNGYMHLTHYSNCDSRYLLPQVIHHRCALNSGTIGETRLPRRNKSSSKAFICFFSGRSSSAFLCRLACLSGTWQQSNKVIHLNRACNCAILLLQVVDGTLVKIYAWVSLCRLVISFCAFRLETSFSDGTNRLPCLGDDS